MFTFSVCRVWGVLALCVVLASVTLVAPACAHEAGALPATEKFPEDDGHTGDHARTRNILQSNAHGYCTSVKQCGGTPTKTVWCNKSESNCEGGCKLKWCPLDGYCSYNNCKNGPPDNVNWCNAKKSQCENACNGKWCTLSDGTIPGPPEFFGWDPSLPKVVGALFSNDK